MTEPKDTGLRHAPTTPPSVTIVFPIEGKPVVSASSTISSDPDFISRILNELDDDWRPILLRAIELAHEADEGTGAIDSE